MGNAQSQTPRRRSVSLSKRRHSKGGSRPDSTRMTIPAASQLNTGSLARVPIPHSTPHSRTATSLQVRLTPLRRSDSSVPVPYSDSPEDTPTTPVAEPASECTLAFVQFSQIYPEYLLTNRLDGLRRADFTRLQKRKTIYLDSAGACLYPESLVQAHNQFLLRSVLASPTVQSASQKTSLQYAQEARAEILAHFDAPLEDYTVIFTQSSTAALALVGSAFPFGKGADLILGLDSHEDLHSLTESAITSGAKAVYIPAMAQGGLDSSVARGILLRLRPTSSQSSEIPPSLFALTGQSTISNSRNSLSILNYATWLGYHTLLDATDLAPSCVISLSDTPVDAMSVSFYKMFGFPTGVGALVVRKSFLSLLRRRWKGKSMRSPGKIIVCPQETEPYQDFEDGTINYLSLPAVTDGLRFLGGYLPLIPLRVNALLFYLASSLEALRYSHNGQPLVRILSRRPSESDRLRNLGEESDCGGCLSLIFYGPSGEQLPHAFVDFAAAKHDIVLQTGQVSGAGSYSTPILFEMHEREVDVSPLLSKQKGVHLDLEVVRVSLGLVNNFEDVWRFVQFVKEVSRDETRGRLWEQWTGGHDRDDMDAYSVRSGSTYATNASGGQVLL